MKLSKSRLMEKIATLGMVGRTPEGGVRRLALTDEDKAGRDLVIDWMTELGLDVNIDQIGNIIAVRAGEDNVPPIMTGSHIDTVYNGGNLDGNLGVLAGLEVVAALNEANIRTKRPIAICAFTNEEGARFQPDMMGSLVYAGGMSVKDAWEVKDDQGLQLKEELKRIGYAGDMTPGEIVPHAFIELHIEQGPLLEQEGITLGAVQNLQGISWTEVTFKGQANHAGTTPMNLRHDAGYCASALNVFVRELASEMGGVQVCTVGTIRFEPDIINVVPSSAKLTVDLRNADNDLLKTAEERMEIFIRNLCEREGVEAETKRLVRFDPVTFDDNLVQIIEDEAKEAGHSCRRMTSGAGHDAQMMARICPTAMIFTPSIKGISHNPAEETNSDDLMAGANTLLNVILRLSQS